MSPNRRGLRTAWSADVDETRPLPDYPRPQLVRPRWLSLNGVWEFAGAPGDTGGWVDDVGSPPADTPLPGRVVVPFPVESALSGVGAAWERMVYRRTFTVPPDWSGARVRLHFGAVDWAARVWLNGVPLGSHRGGYDAFSFDVTDHLTGREEELVVAVSDPTEAGGQPLGKQRRHPGGIFYTSASGIWQTVWLEPVPAAYVAGLTLTPDLGAGAVRVDVDAVGVDGPGVDGRGAAGAPVRVVIRGAGGRVVAEGTGSVGRPFDLGIPDARRWSPDDPFLYRVTAELLDGGAEADRVSGYVGMRSVEVVEAGGVPRLAVNGRPVFHLGPLDQGYWPDGVYTAPTDAALRYDLEVARALGFTCVRKHAKVEPARWYHWADRLGLLVWQDMPSPPHDRAPDAAARRRFDAELHALIDQLRPFPSVAVWVPFNEGWGQHDVARVAAAVAAADPTRLVSENSGSADERNTWFEAGGGHLADIHDYPGPAVPPADRGGRVAVLGEFGGIGLAVAGHSGPGAGAFSYEWADSPERLTDRYLGMLGRLEDLAVSDGLAAAVYTQATDVEGELNGLMTYDRAVLKVDADRVRAGHRRLHDAYRRAVG